MFADKKKNWKKKKHSNEGIGKVVIYTVSLLFPTQEIRPGNEL